MQFSKNNTYIKFTVPQNSSPICAGLNESSLTKLGICHGNPERLSNLTL